MTGFKAAQVGPQGLAFFGVLIAVVFLYWQGLHGELVVDDIPNLQPLGDVASGAIDWRDVVFSNESGPLGRPLSMISLIIDMHLGGGDTFHFKRTNLLIHLCAGLLVYALSLQLFTLTKKLSLEMASWGALFVATTWLFAPLFASTVLYVVQRMAQLSTLFSLLGIWMYVRGRRVLETSPQSGTFNIAGAYLVALPAAVLCKENGALLPALLFIVECYWFRFTASSKQRRLLVGLHAVAFVLPMFLVLGWLAIKWPSLIDSYQGRAFSMQERVLTQCRVLWDYLRQLLIPDGLRMGVVHDDYPPSRGIVRPATTLIAVISWIFVIVAMIRFSNRSIARSLSFGFAFFLAAHSVESSIFPLELYFEHRNYLPAAGMLIGITHAVFQFADAHSRFRRWLPVLFLVPVLYAFITYQRVVIWQSAEAMARIAETSHSQSPRLQTALISLYTRDGDMEKALSHLRLLAELDGGANAAHGLHQIFVFCELKKRPTASDYLKFMDSSTLVNNVYTKERLAAMADLLSFRGCPSVDFSKLRQWLVEISVKAAGDWMMAFQMARMFEALGNPELAIQLLDAADRLDPTRNEPSLIKLRIHVARKDLTSARRILETLLRGDRTILRYQNDLIDGYRRYLESEK